MYKILVSSQSFGKTSNRAENYLINNGCEVTYSNKGLLTERELKTLIKGYDGIIVGIDQVTEGVINAADDLKIICMHGTGTDHIDIEAATRRGIIVSNAPGANNNAVAELTVGLILSSMRSINISNNSILNKNWNRIIGREISGKTIGIIGFGYIGQRVAEILSGFDVKILVYDKYFPKVDNENITCVELNYLYMNSDIISLHLSLNSSTKNMIGERELKKMKKTAIIVNTARGGLIDEDALSDALMKGRISGAALDVFKEEPLSHNSSLLKLNNLIMTPHIGASTIESAENVDMINAESIVNYLIHDQKDSAVKYDPNGDF